MHWSRVGVLLHFVNSGKFDCNDENYDVNDADNDNHISYGLVACGFAGQCTDDQF